MNKMKAWQGSFGVSKYEGIVSPAYFVFTLNGVEGDFFHVAIRSKSYVPFFTNASDGVRIGQWDLSQARMREIPFFIPPSSEQSAIVRYLDYMDRRIRRYIASRQKLIRLLNEQKQAIIHQAVTGQIDVRTGHPYPAYKPSGVEWLGDVPEHWQEIRLKFLTRKITDGEHISPNLSDHGIPLLSAQDVRDRAINYNVDKYVSEENAESFWRRCNPTHGDLLVVSRGATIGRVGVVEEEIPFCLMGSVILCKLREDYGSLFLYYSLKAEHAKTSLWFSSASSAQQAIYIRDVAELRLPVPPPKERTAIVNYLCVVVAEIEKTITCFKHEISLLREYRTRLIADVVTGKRDVREAAAQLPIEEDDDSDSNIENEPDPSDEIMDETGDPDHAEEK